MIDNERKLDNDEEDLGDQQFCKLNKDDGNLAEKDGVADSLADLLVKMAVPRHPQPLLVQLAADDDLRKHVLRRPRLVLVPQVVPLLALHLVLCVSQSSPLRSSPSPHQGGAVARARSITVAITLKPTPCITFTAIMAGGLV